MRGLCRDGMSRLELVAVHLAPAFVGRGDVGVLGEAAPAGALPGRFMSLVGLGNEFRVVYVTAIRSRTNPAVSAPLCGPDRETVDDQVGARRGRLFIRRRV